MTIDRSFLLAVAGFFLISTGLNAQVYEWQYIDPMNPSLGKQQSATLTPDGATADLNFILGFTGRDLTKAYLPGVTIINYRLAGTILNDAYLAGANMNRVSGTEVQLRSADLSGARLPGAHLEYTPT